MSQILRDCQYQFTVVESDKYSSYVQDKKDYLTSIDPPYSFLITHAPLPLKFDFLRKAFLRRIAFAMLIPGLSVYSIIASRMFEAYPVAILAFRRNVVFEINGSTAHFHMAWIIGNIGERQRFISFGYIDSVGDEIEDDDESFSTIGQEDAESIYFH